MLPGHVAAELGEDIRQVFKTLVLNGDKCGHFVCVVPGNMAVDLKAAARVAGAKKAEMIHVKELLPLTGYISGRLLADRDEKAVSYVFSFNGDRF